MLVDRAPVTLDDGVDHAEELLEQRPDLLRVKRRRPPCVAYEIAEHDGDGTPVAVGLVDTIDGDFHLALQRTSAAAAEPIGRIVDVAALAGSRERHATGRAKLAPLAILHLAT